MALQDTPNWLSRLIRQLVATVKVVTFSVSVNPASIAAEASGDTTLTATGALLGDIVQGVGMSADILTGVNAAVSPLFVSVADTVTVHISNNNAAGGAAIDIAAFTITGAVTRLSGS
jgi:hypothetical protein